MSYVADQIRSWTLIQAPTTADRMRLRALAIQVQRMELQLDTIVGDAAEVERDLEALRAVAPPP